MCEEMLPADTANVNLHAFARLATPIFPLMDNAYIDTFYFSIPYRLVFENWRKMMGEQDNPGDSIDFLIPQIVSPPTTGHLEDSIHDFMDIPPGVPDLTHSALWHRCYNLVWNEWFKDENIQTAVTVNLDDGPDPDTDYTLLKRGKRLDYFTSCLPFAAKDYGNPVLLPLGDTAEIIGSAPLAGIGPFSQTAAGPRTIFETGETDPAGRDIQGHFIADTGAVTGTANVAMEDDPGNTGWPLVTANADHSTSTLQADLSTATAATINQLRLAFQIQKMYERDARGGSRYVEIIKSHFGVTTPSAGWRTEYLGGGSSPIGITPVPQTTQAFDTATSGGTTGTLAAYGTANISGNGFTKSFTEHCLVLGELCVAVED